MLIDLQKAFFASKKMATQMNLGSLYGIYLFGSFLS